MNGKLGDGGINEGRSISHRLPHNIEIRSNEEGWFIGPFDSYDKAEDWFFRIHERG